MNSMTTVKPISANWFRRAIAGLAVVGTLSAGLMNMPFAGVPRSEAGMPPVGVAAPAASTVNERYRAMKERQAAQVFDQATTPAEVVIPATRRAQSAAQEARGGTVAGLDCGAYGQRYHAAPSSARPRYGAMKQC